MSVRTAVSASSSVKLTSPGAASLASRRKASSVVSMLPWESRPARAWAGARAKCASVWLASWWRRLRSRVRTARCSVVIGTALMAARRRLLWSCST
eukprot:12877126-Alexandrium_andersonii.AAC.1